MATIVLLHGSWHGAWCWYKIVPRLMALGHKVIAPDLPGHGKSWKTFRGLVTLSSMVRTLLDILDLQDEKVILVVHSRSGIVASTAAELRPDKVDKLIYLASFMLRSGERAADYFFSDHDSLLQGNVDINRLKITDMIQDHIYKQALYADCSEEDVALARTLLTPEPSLPALTRLNLTEENYGSVDRYYIELTEDRTVSLNLQRKLTKALPCKKVFSLEASHSAYFSKPNELCAIIQEIAQLQ